MRPPPLWFAWREKHLGDAAPSTAQEVALLAESGDEKARAVFDAVGQSLAIALTGLINTLNLPLYLLGGGVCEAWDPFSPRMFLELERRSYIYRLTRPDVLEPARLTAGKTYIIKAELGPSAGLLGACVPALNIRPRASDQERNSLPINKYVLRSTLVGALGGLLFVFDTAVISGTTAGITHAFGLHDLPVLLPVLHRSITLSELGITVSIALVGTVVGALMAGILGQRFGSREMLRLTAVLYIISSIGCAFAPTWVFLLAARFIGGLGIGGSSVLGPVYIAELAPPKIRGRLVGTFQINIVVGILLA